MRQAVILLILAAAAFGAQPCSHLEAEFGALDKEYRMARTIKSPTERYNYYYRYLSMGTELMARCRNDQRSYRYTEVVRKLRAAERARAGLRQQVIKEQWRVNNVKPIIKEVYRECTYSY